MRSSSRWLIASTVLLGLLAASGSAQATLTPLPPGTAVAVNLGTPDPLPTGTVQFSDNVTYTTAVYTATVREVVLLDSATGGLDFIYQVVNSASSIDNISQIATTPFNFVNIQTPPFGADFSQTGGTFGTVTFTTPTATGTGTSPSAARPNTSGADTVDFFRNTASPLTPGSTGNILILKTNATTFTTGNLGLINGITSNNPAPVPTNVIPEPGAMAMVLTGLSTLGLGCWFRRRPKLA